MDTRFLLPSSNTRERPFSRVGIAVMDRRRRLNPSNLEMQIFLNLDRDLWNKNGHQRYPNHVEY